jgi:rod shape determining protein RodA
MHSRNNNTQSLDWVSIVLYLLLVGFGWVNIYAANTEADSPVFWIANKEYVKQLIWIGFSFMTIGILLLIDSKFYVEFAYPSYILGVILLLAVIFVGVEVNGAKSWFQLGAIRFQPV